MYFSGSLAIDPSQLTHIEIQRPTSLFGNLAHVLTAGLSSKKEELETFTAVSILQQINMACQGIGINNIVRLAKDDIDIYLDMHGKPDDLAEVMEKFRLETDHYEAELFDNLFLVLEHDEDGVKYLIEIEINRRHKVGAFPIEMKINGVLTDFKVKGLDKAEAEQKMKNLFSSQERYDNFLLQKQSIFNQFVHRFEQAIRTCIKVDHIHTRTSMKMVRPKKKINSPAEIPQQRQAEPIYYGYPGFGDFFFYAWMWSAFSHDHHVHVHDFDLVDEAGATMMSVGSSGFDAGITDTLDPEAPFEAPLSSDVDFATGHDFDTDFADAGIGDVGDIGGDVSDLGLGDVADGGSWFDSLSDSIGDIGDWIDF